MNFNYTLLQTFMSSCVCVLSVKCKLGTDEKKYKTRRKRILHKLKFWTQRGEEKIASKVFSPHHPTFKPELVQIVSENFSLGFSSMNESWVSGIKRSDIKNLTKAYL